tara:strand:- start:2520 stop:2867 length:348 start_codon:yes stop_codon:yes gene_type:complete
MGVRTIRIGGQDVLVEVQPLQPDDELAAVDGLPAQVGEVIMEPVSVARELKDAGERIKSIVEAVAQPVAAALGAIDADEWGLELSLGFKGGVGIPFLANGEANGALKVTAKWKKS